MPNNRRFSEIMLGLFLLFLGASALVEGGNAFMTILVLAGIFMLVRQFENGRRIGRSSSSRRDSRVSRAYTSWRGRRPRCRTTASSFTTTT